MTDAWRRCLAPSAPPLRNGWFNRYPLRVLSFWAAKASLRLARAFADNMRGQHNAVCGCTEVKSGTDPTAAIEAGILGKNRGKVVDHGNVH